MSFFIGEWKEGHIESLLYIESAGIEHTLYRRVLFFYQSCRFLQPLRSQCNYPTLSNTPSEVCVFLFFRTFAVIPDKYSMGSGFISFIMRMKYRTIGYLFSWSWDKKYPNLNEVDTDKYPFLLTLDIFKDKLREKKLKEIGI